MQRKAHCQIFKLQREVAQRFFLEQMMLRFLCTLIVMAAVPAAGQTIYKCPDANGRLSMQDTPCAGGTDVTVKPAGGADAPPKAPAPAPTKTPAGRRATSEAPEPEKSATDKLKDSVALMTWERREREMAFAVRDAENQRQQLENNMNGEIAAIGAQMKFGGSQLSSDLFLAKQQARMTNVRLEYQMKMQSQDAAIGTLERLLGDHRANRPQ